jgi:glycerol-3-phosphate dehydrogenase
LRKAVTAQVEVAVVGAGVVGCATALELARRGAEVVVLEAEPEPGLQASGTNSGILHTGFDSIPGELETEMILRSAHLRDPVIEALEIPVSRCGATMMPRDVGEREAVAALERNARANGVEAYMRGDGALEVPGEAVTDPVAYTLALAQAAQRHGAELRTGATVSAVERADGGLRLGIDDGEPVSCRVAVNCAGLGAGRVARAAGDDSFDVYPRKGEFLVFDPPGGTPLERILLPVPSPGTKGVLVFPTLDGRLVAGPTAVDQEDPEDWSVRPQAAAEIVPKAARLYPPLEGSEPIAAYAGLRPAGRGVNYVIAPSTACEGLVHAAAIRSTGMTASLGIAERVAELVAGLGVSLGEAARLSPPPAPPPTGAWWRRTAEHRARMGETRVA